jgi:hypothetical protein
MGESIHTPAPPLDDLSGEWEVVAAVCTEASPLPGRRTVMWVLHLRHLATGADDDALRCFAHPATSFDVGQRLVGFVDRDRDGLVFRRGARRTGRRR